MARNKSQRKKDFLIAIRKKTPTSITAAPVWAMQKTKRRIYTRIGKRHWRTTKFGLKFKRSEYKQGIVKRKIKSGKKFRKGAKAKLKSKKHR